MALNFSHRPFFSAQISEENQISPMRIANGYLGEGMPERNGDVFSTPWCSNHEEGDCYDCGNDWGDRCGKQDSASGDILDLLPSDPFGMDISTTFTAITGWLEDLEVDYAQYRRDEIVIDDGNYQLYAGLNFIWNNAVKLQEFSLSGCKGFNNELASVSSMDDEARGGGDSCKDNANGEDGAPHPAFYYSLGYLGIKDLLSVGMACKSMQSTVQGDPLLWRHIHISKPLNEKITDDILLRLSERAQGSLHCLSLVECSRITDEGLKRVLDSNPKLLKLSVPGCVRITIEGLLNSFRDLKSGGKLGVRHIRIGGLYGVTKDHYEELVGLLGIDERVKENFRNPRFYHTGDSSCDEERAIDIEMCRKCQNFRLIYDCPSEGCKEDGDGDRHGPQSCRACTLCIQRCVQCGRCINDGEYEETFCLEFLCCDCLNLVRKHPDPISANLTPSDPSTAHSEPRG